MTPAKLAESLGLDFHARTFADAADSPFATEIDTLSTFGLLEGYEDGTFRPTNAITRAEFCAMLSNVLDLPEGQNLSFSDVADDAWYNKAVSAMAARGFVSGMGDGTFRPDDTITYEQMTTILSSVAVWASMSAEELNGKTDISLADVLSIRTSPPGPKGPPGSWTSWALWWAASSPRTWPPGRLPPGCCMP